MQSKALKCQSAEGSRRAVFCEGTCAWVPAMFCTSVACLSEEHALVSGAIVIDFLYYSCFSHAASFICASLVVSRCQPTPPKATSSFWSSTAASLTCTRRGAPPWKLRPCPCALARYTMFMHGPLVYTCTMCFFSIGLYVETKIIAFCNLCSYLLFLVASSSHSGLCVLYLMLLAPFPSPIVFLSHHIRPSPSTSTASPKLPPSRTSTWLRLRIPILCCSSMCVVVVLSIIAVLLGGRHERECVYALRTSTDIGNQSK